MEMNVRIQLAVDAAEAIEGWMPRPELEWLARQASICRDVVEFGTYQGRSAKCMSLAGAGRVWCVDTFLLTPKNTPKIGVWDAAHENLMPEVQLGRIVLVRQHTQLGAKILRSARVQAQMVFIDAGHDYDQMIRDIPDAMTLLAPGGLLCGHDFNRNEYPGLVQAVEELVPGFELPLDGIGCIWAKRI